MSIKTLLVEDSPTDVRIIRELLKQAGGRQVVLKLAGRLDAALQSLAAEPPDVVILDLSLPDSKGLATFRRLRGQVPGVPIVVLTGLNDVDMAVQTIAEGASDYLLKDDLSGGLLVRALRYGMERKRMEEALRQTQRELDLKNRLAKIFLTVPDQQMFEEVLDVLLKTTESKLGFFGYIDEEGTLVCPSMTRVWEQRPMPGKPARFPRETWGGIWGRALAEKKSFYSNEPDHLPDGHIPIRRALAVPLLDREDVIGLFAFANRAGDYDEKDGEFLERVAQYLAPVLHARLQRDAHERALATALAAKEVLLREVHHRVKNNLQVISSLLNMQAETLPAEAHCRLDDSQRRVRSMALVHEQLYCREQSDQLDFADYATSLTSDLRIAYGIDSSIVSLRLDLEPVLLHVDQAIPCALILNELVTNSLKYAFPERRDGEILVALHRLDNQVTLRIADNGVGLPPGFDWRQSNSLGLRIVHILTRQLSGTLDSRSGHGADFSLTFAIVGR